MRLSIDAVIPEVPPLRYTVQSDVRVREVRVRIDAESPGADAEDNNKEKDEHVSEVPIGGDLMNPEAPPHQHTI